VEVMLQRSIEEFKESVRASMEEKLGYEVVLSVDTEGILADIIGCGLYDTQQELNKALEKFNG
jgi:hypothetical protein